MKSLFTLLAVAAFSMVGFGQTGQDVQRYSYHVWGTVLDEESRPMLHLTVCWIPAERPINGRIPCVKIGDDSTFALTVKDIPDKYVVCASTTDSPFIFAGDPDPTHRATCSKALVFDAGDDCRKVNLKFGNAGQ